MKKQIIAGFTFNNKKYGIFLVNDNIYFTVYKDGRFTNNLTEAEYSVISTVYDAILIDIKSAINCGTYKINGKDYSIFLDRKTKLYFFYEIKNGKKYAPNTEDLIYLNKYYNNQTAVLHSLYEDEDYEPYYEYSYKENSKPVLKRLVKVGGRILTVFLAATVAIWSLPGQARFATNYYVSNNFAEEVEDILNKEHSFEYLVSALDRNENLTDEEKQFIKDKLKTEIEENKEYINLDVIVTRFENLKINYVPYYVYDNDKEQYIKNEEIEEHYRGTYNTITNTITMYQRDYISEEEKRSNYDFYNCDKKTLFHELNHVISSYEFSDAIFKTYDDTGKYIMESINEIFSIDYYGEESSKSYRSYLWAVYALCEIIPEDVLREYKFNDNPNYITDYLLTLDDNIENVYNLLTSINSIEMYIELYKDAYNEKMGHDLLYYDSVSTDEDEEKIKLEKKLKIAENELANNYKRIYESISFYYEKKYNRSMDDDLIMLLHLNKHSYYFENVSEKLEEYFNIEDSSVLYVEAEGYFCKEQNGRRLIVKGIEGFDEGIIIDDSNRYISETREKDYKEER